MNFSLASKKWVRVVLHIAFWLLLFSLPWLLRPAEDRNAPQHKENILFLYQYLVNFLSWICLFYINSYVLIPKLFYQKKYLKFALSYVLLFGVLISISRLSFQLLLPTQVFSAVGFMFFYFFPSIFILTCSTTYTMFVDRLRSDRLAQEKETENLKTELAFLRSQVSPHFMFNVLNNMVLLARKQSEQLEPSLIKLSSLLRYMLYETDEDKVLLEREVDYLQSYIDLQKQRFGSKVKVNLKIEDVDKSYFIEPMLLIPFVENAFKHGTGLSTYSEICIELKAANNILQFMVSNNYEDTPDEVKDKTSGIGLQNVRRRLNLLYKNNHTFLVTNKDQRFSVSLLINLH